MANLGVPSRDRRERFVALAEARTDKALKALRLVGNLANRSNYEYTEDDVQQILRSLDQELRLLRVKFTDGVAGRETEFRLKRP